MFTDHVAGTALHTILIFTLGVNMLRQKKKKRVSLDECSPLDAFLEK